jgi:predicted RNase H-like HicB family nuclease
VREYVGIIHKDPDSDYSVSFPDFPGCVTAGGSLEEARSMAEEALAFHIDGLMEDGDDPDLLSESFESYSAAGNLRYRLHAGSAWIEPLIGARYSSTNDFADLDGHAVRLSGGARIGASFDAGGVIITPSLAGTLYGDVDVEGYTSDDLALAGIPQPRDELFEQIDVKVDFDFGHGFSVFAAGNVRHGDIGDGRDVVGAGGQAGLTYRW